MTRSDLKTLIRECLVEILTEGVNAQQAPRSMSASLAAGRDPIQEATRSKLRGNAGSRPAADGVQDPPRRKTIGGMNLDRPALQREVVQRPAAQQEHRSLASKITSDPILSSIFADTAATTLQEQRAAERMRPETSMDPIARAVAEHEPSELFGDAADKWASLAFR